MLRNNLKIVSIIPARCGSKGVLGKNIRSLGGVPLIAWSINSSLKSDKIDHTIISTDSLEYAEIAKSWGADAPFLRPEEISQDQSTDLDFVLHALDFFKHNEGLPDLLIHLRPTTPFRDPLVIDAAIEFATNNYDKITSLRSVHEMSESAYKSLEIGKYGNLITVFTHKEDLDQSNLNRQTFPTTYVANGYIDILFPRKIIESGVLHGNRVKPFLTSRTLEIDTEEDFQNLEIELKTSSKFKDQLFGANNDNL